MGKFLQGKIRAEYRIPPGGEQSIAAFDRGCRQGLKFMQAHAPIPSSCECWLYRRCCMCILLKKTWSDLEGQDIAEYAVMVGALVVLIFAVMRAL